MDTRYRQDRSGQSDPSNPRPARPRPRYEDGRPRPQGASRPAQGSARRAPAGAPRRPAGKSVPPRRRPPKKGGSNALMYVILAVAIVIIVAVSILVLKLTDPNRNTGAAAQPESTATVTPVDPAATPDASAQLSTDTQTASSTASMSELLGQEDSDLSSVSGAPRVQVDDLCVTPGLSEEWMNILLLGSDERKLSDSARTDSMIICSINMTTGQVKLTSLMRDTAVAYEELGSEDNVYRINAANFFGNEQLAMRVVNRLLNMNIQYYVHVNFYGFQQIAQMLGGVDMDISKEEMDEINYRIQEQYRMARKEGIDESALPNEFLETYGENTHLDGRQTLAYARIRKLDGGDYERSNRQRRVLAALMGKVSGKSAAELLTLGTSAMEFLKTNMSLDSILAVAIKVTSSGLSEVDSLRLPVNGSFVQETRNGQDMLYDCDWNKNASELHYFIYDK